jgi:hypothetical protein
LIPEIDIWRAANLVLKRYGEKALEESAARVDQLAGRRRSRRRGDLAPDYRRRRAAREHNTARASALTLRRVLTNKSSYRFRNTRAGLALDPLPLPQRFILDNWACQR